MIQSKLRTSGTVLFAAVVFVTQSGYDSCTGDLLHDSGFDMWCGEELCSWKVERGEARKVPTWHRSDPGVEPVGDDVVLSQRTNVDSSIAGCVRFELVADIAETATVTLEMDVFADGAAEYERQLPTSDWAPLTYVVVMPARYQGLLFRLHKSGGGRAVLGQIRARTVDVAECSGAPILAEQPLPLGGACYSLDPADPFAPSDDVCASGQCSVTRPGAYLPYACGECAADADCAGELCGVVTTVAPFLDPYRACVAAGSRALGELCTGDGECATGVCCEGTCAGCCQADERGCPAGRSCGRVEGWPVMPLQCDPRGRRGEPGEPCLAGEDCASGACAGGAELRVCPADGRLCAADADCPPDMFDDAQGKEFGTCALIGTAGGSCR